MGLSLAIAVLGIVAGAVSFLIAFDEAYEEQDDLLRQVAGLLRATPDVHRDDLAITGGDPDSRLHLFALATPEASPRVPEELPDGLHSLAIGDEEFRALIFTLADGHRLAIAQETDARNETALASALFAILPLACLLPILLWVVRRLIDALLGSLRRTSLEVEQRDENNLGPVALEGLPEEILPLISAINRLLRRIDVGIELQRRFIADAAHELRSPLTAVSLQAERLATMPLAQAPQAQLGALRTGIDRARNVVEKLLTLARAQSAPRKPPPAPCSARAVLREVVEQYLPLAASRGVDLGIVGDGDAPLQAEAADLVLAVGNLVENAIHHSPSGAPVDLSVELDGREVELRVEDHGPGIDPAELDQVFDAFHRAAGPDVPGTGLGLAIVRTLASRVGATVSLRNRPPPDSGLVASVCMPRADGAGARALQLTVTES